MSAQMFVILNKVRKKFYGFKLYNRVLTKMKTQCSQADYKYYTVVFFLNMWKL